MVDDADNQTWARPAYSPVGQTGAMIIVIITIIRPAYSPIGQTGAIIIVTIAVIRPAYSPIGQTGAIIIVIITIIRPAYSPIGQTWATIGAFVNPQSPKTARALSSTPRASPPSRRCAAAPARGRRCSGFCPSERAAGTCC